VSSTLRNNKISCQG